MSTTTQATLETTEADFETTEATLETTDAGRGEARAHVPVRPGFHWSDVCAYADLIPERGVCAMVGGVQAAVFRTFGGDLYSLSNLDPFSGAHVLSRGILGTRDGVPVVASPMYKQAFDLRTGSCLDDPRVAVPAFPVRCAGGRVEVAVSGERRR